MQDARYRDTCEGTPVPTETVEILPQFFVLQAPNRTVPFKALNAAQAVKICTAVFRTKPGTMVSWRLSSTETTLTWHFQEDMEETPYALTLDRWRYLLDTSKVAPQLPTTVALEADLMDYLSIPF